MGDVIYTPEQQEAIDHRGGNLLILACAGSGKTEVVSRRIAELVRDGTPKSAIIAFTFTERAAGELKSRIRQHLEEIQPENPALGDMYVGTIHSFSLNLLGEIDSRYLGYEVMDEDRQAALIMTNFHFSPERGVGIGLDQLRSRTRSGRYWDTVRTFITTLNVIYQKSIDPDDIADQVLRSAVCRYRRVAYGNPNYFFDFDSIISELLQKLKREPATLARLRQRFEYLVVDEYQDVDDRQEELIWLLSAGGTQIHVTAVGDDDQAIYRWRGAKIENILNFSARYPGVREIKLDSNFRSTHVIVEIANRAIRKIPPARRIPKAMSAKHWSERERKFVETMGERGDVQLRTFGGEEEEAEWIACRIEQLRGTFVEDRDGSRRAIDYADMAILLRSVRLSGQTFAEVLRKHGIRAVVKGTGGLFDHNEVLLVYAAFCLLARTDCVTGGGDSWRSRGERETRDLVRELIRELQGEMPYANAVAFLEWVAAKREELDRRNLEKSRRGHLARRIYPQAVFQEMLGEIGIRKGAEPWSQDILFNLGRLSHLITQFESVHQWITPGDLPALCIYLGGWAASSDEGGLTETRAPGAVQIMTVHAAKGLEWPVVFVPRVSSHIFPSSRRGRGPETFLDSSLFNPKEYAVGDEGERRLWYVALTRCRKFLNISSLDCPRKRPTDFYGEIAHGDVQREDPIGDRLKGKPTPPADVELLPTTYTDLSFFWRCPFEYQLRSLMEFSPGVGESYGYGKQIHNVLAEIHRRAVAGEHLSPDEAADLLKDRFHLRYTRAKPFEVLREAAKETVRRYIEMYPDCTRFVLSAEKPFEFVDEKSKALISGTIDLLERIDRTPSGDERRIPVAIVDFKTRRHREMEHFERDRVAAEDQLRLYAVAVRKALGFEARSARVHFLSPAGPGADIVRQGASEIVDVDVSPEKQEAARDKAAATIGEIRAAIESGSFELTGWRTGHCRRCDFRQICRGYECWKNEDRVTPRPGSLEDDNAEEIEFVEEDIGAG